MKRTREEKLLNPVPGGRIAPARDFGIDLTLLIENLKLTPAERLKNNDAAINDLIKFEEAIKRAKRQKHAKIG